MNAKQFVKKGVKGFNEVRKRYKQLPNLSPRIPNSNFQTLKMNT